MSKILGELCSSSKRLHAFPKLHNHPIHSMFLQSQKYLSNSAFLTNIYMLFENRIAIHSNAMSYMVNCNDSVLSLVCGVCKAFVWSYLEASVSLMYARIVVLLGDLMSGLWVMTHLSSGEMRWKTGEMLWCSPTPIVRPPEAPLKVCPGFWPSNSLSLGSQIP